MANLPTSKDVAPFEWKLSALSGGANYEDLPWNCADNQSPKTINIWYNSRILGKRWGTKNLNTAIGTPILSAYPLKFMGKFVFTSGTKMFAFDTGTNVAAQIYSGLTANKGTFLKFAGYLYYLNGAQYIKYDGTTASAVVPFVPKTKIMCTPAGVAAPGGQDYNRIGSGIQNGFVGDGTSTVYTLGSQNLDATAVTASFDDGVTFNKVEGTNFTVNRVTGTVTFLSGSIPPTGGGKENVVIQYYVTNQPTINEILNCTQITAFGGLNNSYIFFGANGTQKYYFSNVSQPEYIPISQYNLIGTSDDAITGFGLQYATLCIFKGRSVYGATYSYDSTTGKPVLTVANINAAVGCDCPGTIRLINDRLVFCNTYGGVYTLVYTNYVALNIDLKPISRNINGNQRASGLLQEVSLTNAIAIEFNRGYWLTVNNHVYYWDYGLTPYQNASDYEAAQKALSWWFLKDLPISCYMYDGRDLYFGDNAIGRIVHFEESFADVSNVPTVSMLNNSASSFKTGTSDTNSTPISFIDGSALQLAFNGSASGNILSPQFKSTGKNIFNPAIPPTQLVTATVSQAGNNITVTSTASRGYAIYKLNLIPNKMHFISYSSTRTGSDGGGIRIMDSTITNDIYQSTPANRSLLNGSFRFAVPANGIVNILLYGNEAGSSGDAATFSNIQLEQNGFTAWEQYKQSLLAITGTIGASGRFTWDGVTGKINGSAVATSGNLIAYQNGNIFVQNFDAAPATVVPVSEITYIQSYTTAKPINASWKLADRNFGSPEMRKTVIEEWISARSDTASTIGITHYSDRDPNGSADSKPITINPSFSWSTLTWSNLFWGVAPAIQSFYRRCRRKNIKYYAIEFSNNVAGQDMNISDLRMNVSIDQIDRKG